jgi:hypothetical protein
LRNEIFLDYERDNFMMENGFELDWNWVRFSGGMRFLGEGVTK